MTRGASRADRSVDTEQPDPVTCVAVSASSAGVNTSGTSVSCPTTSPTVAATLSGTETISSVCVVSSVTTVPSGARIVAETTTEWPVDPAVRSNVASRAVVSYTIDETLALVAVTLVKATSVSPPTKSSFAPVYAYPAARLVGAAPSTTKDITTLVGNAKISEASYSFTVYFCEKSPIDSATVALCCCFSCTTNEYTATPASSVALTVS